ncbi:hypothetical protein ACUN9V_16670 [Salinicola sp. V024]|uniref:Pentapeptide MXKDX repeat protein n=1 Tax=Salinicola lusitanus TaxID=1949085 RepID=A0ABZ3CV44_9GAMM
MRKFSNIMLTATIITVGTFGAGSLFAQENARNEKLQTKDMPGNMMDEGGGMHENMGAQMSSMMEKCNAMMEMMQKKQVEGA